MDLAGEEAVDRAEADIRAINSSVQIIRTKHCEVDLGAILNRKGYSRNAEVRFYTL
jgi:G3E family GTPase